MPATPMTPATPAEVKTIHFTRVIPILRIFSVEKRRSFTAAFLVSRSTGSIRSSQEGPCISRFRAVACGFI